MNETQFDSFLEYVERNSDSCLIRIKRHDWQIDKLQLENFLRQVNSFVIGKYEEIEVTQRYSFTNNFLRAKDSITGRNLGYLVEEGFTTSELSATHAFGWEFERIIKSIGKSKHPIDFEFYIFGYK